MMDDKNKINVALKYIHKPLIDLTKLELKWINYTLKILYAKPLPPTKIKPRKQASQ